MIKYSFIGLILLVVASIITTFMSSYANDKKRSLKGTLIPEDSPEIGDDGQLTCTIMYVVSPNCSYTATGPGKLSATGIDSDLDDVGFDTGWGTTGENID